MKENIVNQIKKYQSVMLRLLKNEKGCLMVLVVDLDLGQELGGG